MPKNKNVYDESSIQVLEGLEPVRKKFGMYIGNNDWTGLWQILKEVISNSLDEALQGFNNALVIAIDTKANKFLVADAGRGIPVGIHKTTKISTLTTILTVLHAGGKIAAANSAYGKGSAGTFGVGVSVTNALSKSLKAYTFRDGKWWGQEFAKGKIVTEVKKLKVEALPKFPNFAGKGTIISFESDEEIFGKTKFQLKEPIKWIKTIAYFFPQVKFTLIVDGKKEEFQQKDGISALVKHWLAAAKVEPIGKTFYIQTANVTCALQWAEDDDEHLSGYVNALQVNLGTHTTALNKIITDTFAKYAPKRGSYKPENLRTGLFGILNIAMTSPAFGGQTKEKLLSPEAKDLVTSVIKAEFEKWAEKNKAFIKDLITRAINLAAAEAEWKVNKKAAAKLVTTKNGRTLLPENLTTSITKDPKLRELFICEGRSAEGTAVNARDPQFQEILPLRGKVLNVHRAKDDKIAANKEVEQMLQAIGYNPNGKANPFEKLRVDRVMLLADADADGCVASSTRILTLDGKNPTIRDLAKQWKKAQKPIWVYSRKTDGTLIPTQAVKPRKTVICDKEAIITFDDGTRLTVTTNHQFMVNTKNGWVYKEAQYLKPGDSINSIYFEQTNAENRVNNYRITFQNNSFGTLQNTLVNNHKVVSVEIKNCKPKQFYCMTVPETGNFFIADKSGNGIGSSNSHINLLLSGFIYKALRPLIAAGRVYVVNLPLFSAPIKNGRVYGHTLKELNAQLPANYNPNFITRMKGLGESLHPKTLVSGTTIEDLFTKKHGINTPNETISKSNYKVIRKLKTEVGTVLSAAGPLMCHPLHPVLILRNLEFVFDHAKNIKHGDYLVYKLNYDQDYQRYYPANIDTYVYDLEEIKILQNMPLSGSRSFTDFSMDACKPHDAPLKILATFADETAFPDAQMVLQRHLKLPHLGEDATPSGLIGRLLAQKSDKPDEIWRHNLLTLFAADTILDLRFTPFVKSEFFHTEPHYQYDISIVKNKFSVVPHITDNTFIANNLVVHNCNPDVLREIAFNKQTRRLIKLMPVTGRRAKRFLSTLEAEADFRREILGLANVKDKT